MSESQSGYLSPDEITNVSFETKRRGGLDPDAVKRHLSSVAATVHGMRAERDTLLAQVDALRDELSAMPEPSQAPVALDEAELTERLGQDAARVLSEARAAAADRLAEAEEEAAAILAAAEEVHAERSAAADLEAQRIRATAESVVEERRAEADRAAAEIVAAAEADAEHARTAGSSDRETADAEAARIIREAELTRRQILEDLARRRSSARRQIEQLRAGRERLLASHETVRRALDEISDELTISMSEARAAAETAGHSVSDTTIEELEAEIETARLTGLLDTGPLPVVERRPAAKRPAKPAVVAPVSKSTPSSEIGVAPSPENEEVADDKAPGAAEGSTESPTDDTTESVSEPSTDSPGGASATTTPVTVADDATDDSANAEANGDTSADDQSDSSSSDLAPVVQLDRARSEVDTATHPAKGRDAGNGRSTSSAKTSTPVERPEPAPAAKVTKLESVKAAPEPEPGETVVDSADTEDVAEASAEAADVDSADAPDSGAPDSDAPDVDAVDSGDGDSGDEDSVGDLFASLRSETPKPAAPKKSSAKKASPTKKTAAAKKSTANKPTDNAVPAAALVDVDSSEMARRLKRVLADEQSRAMSKVKSSDELPVLADLLGSDDEHVETYWVEVLGQLDDASDGTDEVRAPVRSLVDDIRRRVGGALDGADGDSESAVNALRSVYRELKTQKITPCADAVCRTAGVGVSS